MGSPKASSPSDSLILGAVAYDPKVVTIWDGFQHYFRVRGLALDYVLYSNYESQVEALVAGQIHIAWNSPLAWLQAKRLATALGRHAEALCMRDTDCDLATVILVRSESEIRTVVDLNGRTVAVGAADSPQATLIPLNYLAEEGLEPHKAFKVMAFDALRGKHGDHVGGERDAVRALVRGEADAACILDTNHLVFAREGTIASGTTRILTGTPVYDHCNMTLLDCAPVEAAMRFRDLLLEMSYSDGEVRPLLDLEGLKRWVPGRVSGYEQLSAAVDRFGTIDSFVSRLEARWK
jgi:ABC-type phosphate/phosphonate transport system substrate-binding protein